MHDEDREDRLSRAISRIRAIKDHLPDHYEVEQTWAVEYHDAISGLETQLSLELSEFRVPDRAFQKSVSSSNYITGEVRHRDGLWCQRSIFMQKVDALLYYLNNLYSSRPR